MPLEHENGDERLLTTDEAERVIELYAEREQARRAEMERIASMPRLSDIAVLVGATVEELRPLLARLRGELPSEPTPLDGDIRLAQFEADRLVELHGRTERERQAELERRAQMASLDDIAEGLSIPVDEAADLLKEVRRRKAQTYEPVEVDPPPMILLPRRERVVEEPEWTYEEANTEEQNRVIGTVIVGVLVALVLIVAVASGLKGRSTSFSPYSYGPTYSRSVPYTSQPYSTYGRSSSHQSTYLAANSAGTPTLLGTGYVAPPAGWTIRVYGPDGVATLPPGSKASRTKADETARLAGAIRSFAWSVPTPHMQPNLGPMYPLIPYAPAAKPKECSDIAGASIVEVQKGNTVRRAYILRASDTETEQRIAYLAGNGQAVGGLQGYEVVKDAACKPPPGVTVTVFAYGRAYRSVGGAAPDTIDIQRWRNRIKEATTAMVRRAYAKNAGTTIVATRTGEKFVATTDAKGNVKLVPFQTWVSVSSVGGTSGTNVFGYAEAQNAHDRTRSLSALRALDAVAAEAAGKLEDGVFNQALRNPSPDR